MVKYFYLIIRFSHIAILLNLFTSPVWAQDMQFTASVDRRRIAFNEQVQLTLTIAGPQDVPSPELPSLNDFKIISQGSSSQFSFINGKMSASKSYSYMLLPLKEGTLTIAPAEINIGGKIYKTNTLTVTVLPAGAKTHVPSATQQTRPSRAETPPEPLAELDVKDRIFIEVATDKKEAFIGEQVTMIFKFYRQGVMIDNLQYQPPVTKGFITEAMGPQKEYQELVNGAVYDVIELQTAIFPVSCGALEIEPAKLSCNLLVRSYGRRPRPGGRAVDDFFDGFFDDSFFSSYTRYPVELVSDPVTINVIPLPFADKPPSFRGAVGTYDLHCAADPPKVPAGEPVNLIMKISGAGNIGAVPEPVITGLTGFKTYDSEIKTEITGRDPEIAGEKTFQKMLIPLNESIKEIPLIEFSYFDPVKNNYHTIKKGPFPLTVTPAPKKDLEIVELIKQSVPEDDAAKAVKLLAKDIQYIKTAPGVIFVAGHVWYQNIFLWLAAICLPLVIIIFCGLFNSHRIKLRKDIAYAKTFSAYRTARKTLEEAVALEKADQPKECYDALARALQKFITDKLVLPAGTLNVDNLITKNIGENTVLQIKALLANFDLARFGAVSFSRQDLKKAVKETAALINMLNKKL